MGDYVYLVLHKKKPPHMIGDAIMNVSRDTATAFALDKIKARRTMQTSIYCRYDYNNIFVTTLCGTEFRILGVVNGKVHIPIYHSTTHPPIYWSTL